MWVSSVISGLTNGPGYMKGGSSTASSQLKETDRAPIKQIRNCNPNIWQETFLSYGSRDGKRVGPAPDGNISSDIGFINILCIQTSFVFLCTEIMMTLVIDGFPGVN